MVDPACPELREGTKLWQGIVAIPEDLSNASPAHSGGQPGMRVSRSLSIRDLSPVTRLSIF